MAIISSYPNNDTASGDDRFLTVDSDGSTKLTTVDTLRDGILTNESVDTDTLAESAVTAAKLGSDVGAYEILGRTTLTVAGDTITVSGFTPKKYMRVDFLLIPSGSINSRFIFNNDTGNNYSQQFSTDNAASTDLVSQGFIELEGGSGARLIYGTLEFINVSSQEKLGINNTINNAASSGAGTAPDSFSNWFKWANTSAQVNRIDFLNQGTGSTGDLGIGSEVVVLGRN